MRLLTEVLPKEAREEIALAIMLWKDFKSASRYVPEIYRQAMYMAKQLGVSDEYVELRDRMPVMRIDPVLTLESLKRPQNE